MPAPRTTKNIVGYHYHSTGNVSWRHSELPGVHAIPHSELRQNPAAVLDFIQNSRWPTAVEHGWEPIAMALPFRSDTVEMLGSMLVREVTEKQINAASVRRLKDALGLGALVLAIGEDRKPGIILTQFDSGHRDEYSVDFDKIARLDDKAAAVGSYMHDPDSGHAFSSNMIDDFAGSRFAADMQHVHQRRL